MTDINAALAASNTEGYVLSKYEFEVSVDASNVRETSEHVTISRDDLDILLWFAERGDKAMSQRRWRNWFRKTNVCAHSPEPTCTTCDTFAAARALVGQDEEKS